MSVIGRGSFDSDTPVATEALAVDEVEASIGSDLKTELNDTPENKNMDQFHQRMRTDLMYELRNIRHGERPVTGQSHRENLQQFMEKHMMGRDDGFTAGDKERNIPANVDSVEKHRPEAVVVEVC